jgi:hypothetical protein
MSDASMLLRELSEPWSAGERVKGVLVRTAKAAGLSFWRTSDIWYGKARRVEDYEIAQITAALHRKKQIETRNELQELRRRLQCLESRLVQTDADFHRQDLHQIGHALSRSR